VRKSLTIAISIAALLMAGSAWAEGSKADYGRSGWYVGAGGGVAWDFLSDFIEDETFGLVTSTAGGTANVRGGYRIWSWFALEAMYEGAYGVNTQLLGDTLINFDTHAVLANLKFIVPIWRTHPYFALGFGAQYGNADFVEGVLGGVLVGLDTNRWDPMMRFGLGLDTYVTENWLVNVEIAPGIRFKDWDEIGGQATDNVTMTLSFGVQYRF
jgi:opacity protein-like surface antigen